MRFQICLGAILTIFALVSEIQPLHAQSHKTLLNEAVACGKASRKESLASRRTKNRLAKSINTSSGGVSNALACQRQLGGYESVIKKYRNQLNRDQAKLHSIASYAFHRRLARTKPAPTKRLAKFIRKLPKTQAKRVCGSWIGNAKRR